MKADAERLGWTVGEIYIDDDVSAYRRKDERPVFAKLVMERSSLPFTRSSAGNFEAF